jgi:hypothetical protein
MKSPEELKQHVSKQLKRGYPSGELKEELLKQGYTTESIEKAFSMDGYSSSNRFGLGPVLLSTSLILLGLWQMKGNTHSPNRMVEAGSLVVLGFIGLVIKLVDVSGKKW